MTGHSHADALRHAVERVAVQVSTPDTPTVSDRRFAQSLGKGAAGTALVHIELALDQYGSWATAHRWVKAATAWDISGAEEAALFIGAPSIAFMLHAANADGRDRYSKAITTLDRWVIAAAHRRVDAALSRIGCGQTTRFAEYDLFYGLTGIGAFLLRHHPGNDVLGRILSYLVQLATKPVPRDGTRLPGWWVDHDPDQLIPTPGGHLNFGLAHGIAGPLALLSLSARAGVIVDRQLTAIESINAQMDDWRQPAAHGFWWPEWITSSELRTGQVHHHGPPRPSWCYGTPGIARAQQLAAIALGTPARQAEAEYALAASVADADQLAMITGVGVCHGIAGVYQTAWRASRDAVTSHLSEVLPDLAARLLARADDDDGPDNSLLEGRTGLALALLTASRNASPTSGWDACLLIT